MCAQDKEHPNTTSPHDNVRFSPLRRPGLFPPLMSFINLVSRELKLLLITRIKSLLCQRKLNYSNFQGHGNIQRGQFDNPKNNAITKKSKTELTMEDWLQLYLLSDAECAPALPPMSYCLGHPSQSGLPVNLATRWNSSLGREGHLGKGENSLNKQACAYTII